jgi:hypothetical protein
MVECFVHVESGGFNPEYSFFNYITLVSRNYQRSARYFKNKKLLRIGHGIALMLKFM